jgi:hypothetical protein
MKQAAIRNWVKLGMKIQMVQAFKLLDQIQSDDKAIK